MNKVFSSLLIAAGLSSFAFAEKPDLNQFKTPSGYQWQACRQKDAGCAFLVPDGWTVWHTPKRQYLNTQIVSPGNYNEQGIISLSVLQDVKQKTGFNAVHNMQRIIKDIEQTGLYKLDEWNKKSAPFKSKAISIIDNTSKNKPVRCFYLLVANEKTDTLYRIKFTAPNIYWNVLWPKVEPVFKQLFLDKSI